VEYLIRHQYGTQNFHREVIEPVDGQVALPREPGLGFALDDSKIERRKAWQP